MSVSLSIKNVPDAVAERLREQARRHHRSLQGELLAILEQATARPLSVAAAAALLRASGFGPSADDSTELIRRMRDGR